jgi:hypothetical protein
VIFDGARDLLDLDDNQPPAPLRCARRVKITFAAVYVVAIVVCLCVLL